MNKKQNVWVGLGVNKKGNTKIMNYCKVIPTFVTIKLMKEKGKGLYFSYVNVMVHMNFDQFYEIL